MSDWTGYEWERLLRGESQVWQEFVDRFSPVIQSAVSRTLVPRGHSDEDVADVVQDVFVRLCRHECRQLRRFDPERSSLVTWLTIVARGSAIDWLRRTRLDERSIEAVEEPAQRDSPSFEPIDLPPSLLSPREVAVLRLLFDQNLTVDEVAEALGITAQTVRSTKHNAIKSLRAHLGLPRSP